MKKITIQHLKQIIQEEYLKGVPEFVLRQTTENYVKELKRQITKHILQDKSQTTIKQKEAIAAMTQSMDDFEKEVNDLLENNLWNFLQKT